ncbi:unnamed protein product [Lepeophtheirus salmonis]|uniref:(salmon louse) hypothetical protein n=1 Tax=Lepeophtheirus salmonis TaxID=72036 RepID=A0A7R8CJ31_LEPSM|nr:unnamed protein product [Lepeophtheirus salmonis]CAF2831889.1 unnamed protein product [Lepeophtheirus salmonis]
MDRTPKMKISVGKLTKVFVLYYLHRILPDDKFNEYLQSMTNAKEMVMAIEIFNGKIYSCDEILNYTLDSQIFKDLCKKIDFTNKLVLNYLKNASLLYIRRQFQEAVEMNSDISLESVIDSSSVLFSTSNRNQKLYEVVDLTFMDSSDHSSSPPSPDPLREESNASSDSQREKEKWKIRTINNDDVILEEEEVHLILRLPRKQKELLPKDFLSQTKWTIDDDKLIISFVHSEEDNIMKKKWKLRKKISDFLPYEELFQRSASALYNRWKLFIYPFLNETTLLLLTSPWLVMVDLLPINNLQTYKGLFDNFKNKSRKTSFTEIIAYAITNLTEKLYHINKLKTYHESFLKVNKGSQSSKHNSSNINVSAKNVSTSLHVSQIRPPLNNKISVKDDLICSPLVSTVNVRKNLLPSSILSSHQPQNTQSSSNKKNDSFLTTTSWHSPLLSQAKNPDSSKQDSNEKMESHLIPNTLRLSTKNNVIAPVNNPKNPSFEKSGDKELNWSLNHDMELLYAVLRINPLFLELFNKIIFPCFEIDHLRRQFSMDIDLLKNRWDNVLVPALKTKYSNANWEWNEKNDLKRLVKTRLLSMLEELFRNPDLSEKTQVTLSTVDIHKIDAPIERQITQVSFVDNLSAPFEFSESKAIVDHVFLYHPNLDLQTSQMKSSFFKNLLPSRPLHCVHMHWEKTKKLEILKKVIGAYPDEDASLVSPSIKFFTNIAPLFDRKYVSLKDHWHRSIRLMLLLFKHKKINGNWEYDVLSHFVRSNIQSRQNIDWPNTMMQFPYLTTNAISSVLAYAMKKKKTDLS